MKKIFSIILAMLILMTTALPAFAADASSEISPRYNNTSTTSVGFTISSSGKATASYSYNAYAQYFTGATVTTKIQKRTLGLFWTTVEDWTDNWTSAYKSCTHSYQLTDSGTYRAVVEFEIRGTNGAADKIESTSDTKTY